ncbi:cobalt ABC transporter permease [Rhodovulum strictum]|uniref:Cobalt ABC transporter permease n=1 Tax=Rhodovulum strictum TaxID=58314 RepID=A0A844BGP7_9RHOB|nr:cobalt ABC transporter permease [Rhodovulum strictum]MRH21759.1 cobalt ABC transporter permease [Rhodovulum strictum]
MIRTGVLLLCLALAPLSAQAHRVVAAAYPAGEMIEGEVGFSNGDMAAHQLIEVFGDDGTRLGEAMTDANGVFRYRPDRQGRHVFRADLGAGHVAEFELGADEIAAILGQPADAPAASLAGLSEADRAAIASMLRDELRPLRREIAALKERNGMQSILGGIGYIAGLFGLGFYLAARRRLRG